MSHKTSESLFQSTERKFSYEFIHLKRKRNMRIALFFENDMFCCIDDSVEDKHLKVLILDVDADMESKTETTIEYITKQNINYISLWLLSSRINRILVSGISEKISDLFEKMSVSIKIVYEHRLSSLLNNDDIKMSDLV